jgi:chromate transporter
MESPTKDGINPVMMMNKLKEIGGVFFKLGCIAFGGPAAHIALMDEEIVEKRKWLSREHFLDLIGATQLIPGPNSTEMTMHCGHERGGVAGLFVAGISFIFPAVVITGILAFLYVEYGKLPEIEPWVYGIKAGVLAIIAGAIIKLGKKALKQPSHYFLAGLVASGALGGMHEVYLLLAAGLFGGLLLFLWHKRSQKISFSLLPALSGVLMTTSWSGAMKIFFIFLKVGSILYGSGYVLFAYLDAELVSQGMLTRTELVEAIAIGQMTPGPVLSTATFIGYQLAGWKGAIAATTGIFLPSFLFVWVLNPLVPKMRQSRFFGFLLDAINVAAVAVMAVVLFDMTYEVIVDWRGAVIGAAGLLAVFGPRKIGAVYVILGSALLGYALHWV